MQPSGFNPYLFTTLRTYGRAPLLAKNTHKQLLLDRLQETKKRFSLTIAGYVLLDDHAHFLFRIPQEYEASAIMNDLRGGFLRAWRKTLPLLQQDQPDDSPFWEHSLEMRHLYSPEELRIYLDFIHYDPVRHGQTQTPSEYRWSSLPARIAQGHYPERWGLLGPPAAISRVLRDSPADRLNS